MNLPVHLTPLKSHSGVSGPCVVVLDLVLDYLLKEWRQVSSASLTQGDMSSCQNSRSALWLLTFMQAWCYKPHSSHWGRSRSSKGEKVCHPASNSDTLCCYCWALRTLVVIKITRADVLYIISLIVLEHTVCMRPVTRLAGWWRRLRSHRDACC